MTGILKATESEKVAYLGEKPVYPLYGFVAVGDVRCTIEDLRGTGPQGDPRYEIMAPSGLLFAHNGTHSLLCVSLDDLRERASSERLEPCVEVGVRCEGCGVTRTSEED